MGIPYSAYLPLIFFTDHHLWHKPPICHGGGRGAPASGAGTGEAGVGEAAGGRVGGGCAPGAEGLQPQAPVRTPWGGYDAHSRRVSEE